MIAVLLEEGRIKEKATKENVRRLVDDFRLDAAEAEAILLARAQGVPCATDDGPAIRCCKVIGVPFVTAVAFLVRLVETGELDAELGAELLEKLQRFGRYHPRVLEDAGRRIRDTAGTGGRR